MKRSLAALLAALLLLLLTGCGGLSSLLPHNDPPAPAENTAPGPQTPDNAQTSEETALPDDEPQPGEEGDSGDPYWDKLRERWKNEPNEGYVWTITIDAVTVLDAAGLAECTYDLDLSCSHVGKEMNGVYAGSLAMDFEADLSGLNALMAFMGGTASTDHVDGWFRNDAFIMELVDYNYEKEQGFIGSLDLIIDENGEVVPRYEDDPYTDAIMGPIYEDMGSGAEDFELQEVPVSYWFDWDYHMTEGDMSQSYSVTGIMGMGSASGGMDASGTHVSGHAVAHSPLGGVYTDRYDETYDAPFPYIIRVYETGQVVFELHSANGGPVVIKFYGTIDKIPVSETTVVK